MTPAGADPTLRVSEIFHSLQGESTRVGLPTVFIRLTGCPLRCTWCDTTYAFAGGDTLTLATILDRVATFDCRTVCVTGGEPLAQSNCLMLLSAFCWALYSLVGKYLLQRYDEFMITTYAFGLGTLFYLPFVIFHIVPVLQQTSMGGWLAVLYLALTCSLFGYLGWYYGLKHIDASKAAVFLNFIPLFTILMSFFLGASFSWLFLLGAGFIIYGVYLTQRT